MAGDPDPRLVSEIVTLREAFSWVNQINRHAPAIDSRRSPVKLRQIRPEDLGPLYDASVSPANLHRWRYRGQPPTPQQFSELLYRGVLTQFIGERVADSSKRCLVNAYNYQPDNQLCYVAALRLNRGKGTGEVALSMYHLLQFVFSRFPLRKVYLEMPEFNLGFVNSSLGFVREEGRLEAYMYFDGTWWDRVFLSITRSDWESVEESWRPFMGDGFEFDP